MADIRIDDLAGIPMLYDRSAPEHYGKGGVPFRPFIDDTFAKQCEACFKEMTGKLEREAGLVTNTILSGGVSRPGVGASYHHKNRAFDLDGLLFDNGKHWVATSFPHRPQLYLGLEAVLRSHFGTVLSYDYNKAHEDHFHFDNGTAPGFKTAAKSHVIFVQNVLVFLYQSPIGRDGVWGPMTDGAVKAVREELGIGALGNKDNWLAFLDKVADMAMQMERGTVAPPLPDNPCAA